MAFSPVEPAEDDGEEIAEGLGIFDPLLLGEEGEVVEVSAFELSTTATVVPCDSLPLVGGAEVDFTSISSLVGGVLGVAGAGNLETGRGILLLPSDWLEAGEEGEGVVRFGGLSSLEL